MKGAGRVETISPFDDRALHITDQVLRFLDRDVVTRYHDYRYIEMPGNGRIDARLGHGHAVEPDGGQTRAGYGMRAYSFGIGGAGVIAQKDNPIERLVDPGHHTEVPGPGADDLHTSRHLIDQQVLAVTVGVTHQYLRSPGLNRRFYRRITSLMSACISGQKSGQIIDRW